VILALQICKASATLTYVSNGGLAIRKEPEHVPRYLNGPTLHELRQTSNIIVHLSAFVNKLIAVSVLTTYCL
jgi:hypothetical protein